MLHGKHIILGITGGIAAYKSAELTRLLKKRGARVTVVMTDGAKEFITSLTFASLTGEPVYDNLWENKSGTGSNIAHINLTRDADALIIAPCTANVMSKIAHGVADDRRQENYLRLRLGGYALAWTDLLFGERPADYCRHDWRQGRLCL